MFRDRSSFWQRHIRDQQRSALSIEDYCRQHRLYSPSFYVWRKRLRLAPRDTPRFVAVPVVATPPTISLEVHLPNGVRITVPNGCSREQLDMTLAALQQAAAEGP